MKRNEEEIKAAWNRWHRRNTKLINSIRELKTRADGSEKNNLFILSELENFQRDIYQCLVHFYSYDQLGSSSMDISGYRQNSLMKFLRVKKFAYANEVLDARLSIHRAPEFGQEPSTYQQVTYSTVQTAVVDLDVSALTAEIDKLAANLEENAALKDAHDKLKKEIAAFEQALTTFSNGVSDADSEKNVADSVVRSSIIKLIGIHKIEQKITDFEPKIEEAEKLVKQVVDEIKPSLLDAAEAKVDETESLINDAREAIKNVKQAAQQDTTIASSLTSTKTSVLDKLENAQTNLKAAHSLAESAITKLSEALSDIDKQNTKKAQDYLSKLDIDVFNIHNDKEGEIAKTIKSAGETLDNAVENHLAENLGGWEKRIETNMETFVDVQDSINKFASAERKSLFKDENPSETKFPPDFVFNRLMQQTSIDYLQIKKALDHEASPEREVAQFLGERALTPLLANNFMQLSEAEANKITVVTYPESHVVVRILPYTPAALIGFPVTATSYLPSLEKTEDLTQDAGEPVSEEATFLSTSFLAVSHEVAHVIYQAGRVPFADSNKDIRQKDRGMLINQIIERDVYRELVKQGREANETKWLLHWLEEIFADVYGCMIEGPVYITGFHELLITEHPTEEIGYHRDHEHPIPIIRPLMQSEILRKLMKELSADDVVKTAKVTRILGDLDLVWTQAALDNWGHWFEGQWPYENIDSYQSHGDQAGDPDVTLLTHATYEINGKEIRGSALLDEMNIAIDLIIDLLIKKWKFGISIDNWTMNWDEEWTISSQAPIKNFQLLKSNFATEIDGKLRSKKTASAESQKTKSQGDDPLIISAPFDPMPDGSMLPAVDEDIQLNRPLHRRIFDEMKRINKGAEDREKMKNGTISFDKFVELLIFSGWSEEGPRGGGTIGV